MDGTAETEDQTALVDYLATPGRLGPGSPRLIQTHGAHVFLSGDRAYKLKRAVRYDFMDLGDQAKRDAAAVAEVRLNRRTAPAMYLGLTPVYSDQGGFRLGVLSTDGGLDPAAIAHLITMRRFPDGAGLDEMAADGRLADSDVDRLADAVARFHDAAPPLKIEGAAAKLSAVSGRTMDAIREGADLIGADVAMQLDAAMTAALARSADLIDARGATGAVRRLHGDLHLGNAAMLNGAPVVFDALEFDDAMATVDVLHDMAFLVMDLWVRASPGQAARGWSRYLAVRDDYEGLALAPLFIAMRAAVRVKVALKTAAFVSGDARAAELDRAKTYAAAAVAALQTPKPRLIAVGGLSGTGKTTIARALAPACAPATGAVHLRSDVLRKFRACVAFEARLPADAYTPSESDAVYAGLLERAETALAGGAPVILDAVFARPAERTAAEALAARLNVPFDGIWLDLPLDVRQARIAARRGDASDATPEVAARQAAYDVGSLDWTSIDAGDAAASSAAAALGLPPVESAG